MNIKKKIKERGLTIEKVAREIGVSKNSLSQTINGNPTFSTLEKIAVALGMTVSELLNENDEARYSSVATCPHCGKALVIGIKKPDE